MTLPLLPKATDTSFYGTARKELAVIIRMLLGGTRRFQYCRSTGATQRFLAFSFGHPRPYVLQNNNAIARSRDCTAIVSKTWRHWLHLGLRWPFQIIWTHVLGICGASEVSGLWDSLALGSWKAPQTRLWQVVWWGGVIVIGLRSVLDKQISITDVESLKTVMRSHFAEARVKDSTLPCVKIVLDNSAPVPSKIFKLETPSRVHFHFHSSHCSASACVFPSTATSARRKQPLVEKDGCAVRAFASSSRWFAWSLFAGNSGEENNASKSMQIDPLRPIPAPNPMEHQALNLRQPVKKSAAFKHDMRVEYEVRPSKTIRGWGALENKFCLSIYIYIYISYICNYGCAFVDNSSIT